MIRIWASSVVVTFSSVLVLASIVFAQDGPAPEVPELKTLNRYVGVWDVSVRVDQNVIMTGTSTSRWVLGGRFVEQTGTLIPVDGSPQLSLTTLYTWDIERQAYRTWTFVSNGSTTTGEGKWDERTKKMTSTGKNDKDGATTETIADFSVEGRESWTIRVKGAGGEMAATIEGTNTRRAAAKK